MKRIFLLLSISLISIATLAQILPPGKPRTLTGSQILLNNQIKLNWAAPSSGTFAGYKIYFQRDSNPMTSIKVGAVLSDTLENLVYNSTYKIYLKTFKLGTLPTDTLYSPSSDTLNILVIGLVAPTPSTEPSLNTQSQIGVIINDTNPFETGFQIELTEGANVTTVTAPANTPGNPTYKPVSGLKPKTFYSIRVRAERNGLFGPWSTPIIVGTKVDNPPAASLAWDKNCPDLIHVTWTISTRKEDVAELILKKSYDNSTFYEINRPNVNASDYWDSDVIPGKTAFYQLYTVNSTNSTPSNKITVTPKVYVKPNPVLGLIPDKVAKYDNFLTFHWTNGTEDAECGTNKVDEIVLLLKKDNETSYTEYKRVPPFTKSIKIEGLKPKSIVNIGIITVSNKGLQSAMVTALDTTWGPSYPPYDLGIIQTVDALGNPYNGLNWKYRILDHDYARIQRSTAGGPFVTIGTIQSSYNYFIDMNIQEGVIYSYRVIAGNYYFGDGEPSEVNGPRIFQYTKVPNAPLGLNTKVNGTKVTATWIDDSNREDSQILEKSSDNGTSYSIVATLAKNITSYSDENVLSGKNYLYRIKAVNSVGESPYSKTTEAKIPTSGLINNNTIGITVFPNPTVNDIKIEYSKNLIGENISVKVYDKMNRIVQSQTFKGNTSTVQEFSFSKLLPGLYNVVINTDGGTISKKVVKF